MTAAEALERERQIMNRDCELIDSAALAGDVVTIVYRVAAVALPQMGGQQQASIRTATYVGERPIASGIVRSEWLDAV